MLLLSSGVSEMCSQLLAKNVFPTKITSHFPVTSELLSETTSTCYPFTWKLVRNWTLNIFWLRTRKHNLWHWNPEFKWAWIPKIIYSTKCSCSPASQPPFLTTLCIQKAPDSQQFFDYQWSSMCDHFENWNI